jgi:sugar/nucleoside kinase (ribokinase family)
MAWTPEQRAAASAKAKENYAKRPRDEAGKLLPIESQTKAGRYKRRRRAKFSKSVKALATGSAGLPGNPPGDASRVRRALNLSTMQELQRAFDRGGRKAIDQVMRTQPALFLKLLVLLVPRELEVTHSAGVKAMSDEQIESAIAAIQDMLARREAKTIDVTPRRPPDMVGKADIPSPS